MVTLEYYRVLSRLFCMKIYFWKVQSASLSLALDPVGIQIKTASGTTKSLPKECVVHEGALLFNKHCLLFNGLIIIVVVDALLVSNTVW